VDRLLLGLVIGLVEQRLDPPQLDLGVTDIRFVA
jgi:hypothetical protein